MKRSSFILFLFFIVRFGVAQQSTIKGWVQFEDSICAEYQIEILYAQGNMPAALKKTFETPDFAVDFLMNTPCTVQFSAPGYKRIDILVEKSKTSLIDLGEIYFRRYSVQLDSVTVTANRPFVRTKGGKMTIDVKNTILSDMGSVNDMLLNTPGLIQGSNGVEVPGKGAPLFIVDDREIKDASMLDILKSDNVESIEIDRSPSAAYSAGTRAIIRIKTIRKIQDYFFLKVNNIASVKRKFSETPSIDFRFKKAKISSYMSFLYSNGGNLIKETYFKEIYHPNYTFRNDSYHEITNKYKGPRFIWSTDFDINKKNRLGLVYYYNYNYEKKDYMASTTLKDSISEARRYSDKRILNSKITNSISLSYNYRRDKNTQLDFVSDYATSRTNYDTRTKETNLGTQAYTDIQTAGKSKYNIYTLSGRYDFNLPFDIKTQAGGKFSYVNTPSITESDNPYLNGGNYCYKTEVNDYTIAGFFTVSKNWKKFGLKSGLRYENTTTRVFTQDHESQSDVSREYSDFFPNIELSYTANDDWNFMLNYSRYISRPGYYLLNSGLIYQDSLSYNEGNTAIRPSFTQDISLYADWKNWSMYLSFNHIKDEIVQVPITKETNSNIINYVPFNFSAVKELSSGLSYRKEVKKFNVYGSVRGSIPHAKYPFMNETVATGMFSWGISVNSTYTFNKKIACYTNFSYSSPNEYMNTYQKSVNQWNFGVRGKFMDNRLTVDLQAMDLLHGSHYNNLYDRYLNVKDGTYGTNDFRGVKLTLSYIIFKNEISVKAKRENEDVLMRTSK